MKLQVLFSLFHQGQNRVWKNSCKNWLWSVFWGRSQYVSFISKLLVSQKCNVIVHVPVWCVFQHYAFHHDPLRSVFRTVYLHSYLHTYTGKGRSSWAHCIVGVFCEVSFVVCYSTYVGKCIRSLFTLFTENILFAAESISGSWHHFHILYLCVAFH